MTQPDRKAREDYDSPWKDILTDYFEQFVRLFFPHIWPDIDWDRGYISLDKELNRITRDAEMREGKLADKLFRVWKKNGDEMWVLVHVEVQAQKKETFPLRTFVYNYRIYDLYKRPVVSLVILADDDPGWHPVGYSHGLWRCRTDFRFPSVKLTDYRDRVEYFEESDNIFAVVVAVHLRTLETKKDRLTRRREKARLTRALFDRGFKKKDIASLYRFIDWIMVLPKELEDDYNREIMKFEEERKMRYITSAERMGMERGTIIGEILLSQRILGRQAYSPEELKGKNVDELKSIFEEERPHITTAEFGGMEKGKRETARNLLLMGKLTADEISRATGLSVEEVERIRDFEKKGKRETARNLLLMGKLTADEISRATGLSVEEVESIRDSEKK